MNFDFKNGFKNEFKDYNEKSCSWSIHRVSLKIDLKAQWLRDSHADRMGVKIFVITLKTSVKLTFWVFLWKFKRGSAASNRKPMRQIWLAKLYCIVIIIIILYYNVLSYLGINIFLISAFQVKRYRCYARWILRSAWWKALSGLT